MFYSDPAFLMCLAGIYTVGYAIALVLSFLNSKLSWIWFYDLNQTKLKNIRIGGK